MVNPIFQYPLEKLESQTCVSVMVNSFSSLEVQGCKDLLLNSRVHLSMSQ